jgi:hypothetical protein
MDKKERKMILPHKEFAFKVLACDEYHKCLYHGCKKMGDFHVVALNDRDAYICDFPNICDMHIIHVFVETLSEAE